jgi:hypothetical protein
MQPLASLKNDLSIYLFKEAMLVRAVKVHTYFHPKREEYPKRVYSSRTCCSQAQLQH